MHGFVETDPHMRLRSKVVDLVRVDGAEQGHQTGAVGEVAVMQEQARTRLVWINVEMIDARRVERRRSTDQPVNLVSLTQ